jgi:hypothetical protein
MSWLYLLGVVMASIPMLAFAVWLAGPIDEVFNWLTDDIYAAQKSEENPETGDGFYAR